MVTGQRHVLAEIIIDLRCPIRERVGGVVPRRHLRHRDPVGAEEDFIEGIQVALYRYYSTCGCRVSGWRWFPHDVHTAGSDLSERHSDDRRVRG